MACEAEAEAVAADAAAEQAAEDKLNADLAILENCLNGGGMGAIIKAINKLHADGTWSLEKWKLTIKRILKRLG